MEEELLSVHSMSFEEFCAFIVTLRDKESGKCYSCQYFAIKEKVRSFNLNKDQLIYVLKLINSKNRKYMFPAILTPTLSFTLTVKNVTDILDVFENEIEKANALETLTYNVSNFNPKPTDIQKILSTFYTEKLTALSAFMNKISDEEYCKLQKQLCDEIIYISRTDTKILKHKNFKITMRYDDLITLKIAVNEIIVSSTTIMKGYSFGRHEYVDDSTGELLVYNSNTKEVLFTFNSGKRMCIIKYAN